MLLTKEKLTLNDFQFNQIDLDNMHIYSIGYNLGDLIMMPAFYLNDRVLKHWQRVFHEQNEGMKTCEIRKHVINLYPNSVLKFYYDHKDSDINNITSPPTKDSILNAINTYSNHVNLNKFDELINLIKQKDVLSVHLRCGDTSLETEYDSAFTTFIKQIVDENEFKMVIFFTGLIPGYSKTMGLENVRLAGYQHSLQMLNAVPNSFLMLDGNVDDHLCIFQNASNLALHRGGISQILSIICPNKIYLNAKTGWWGDKMTEKWKKYIDPNKLTVK